MTNKGIRTLFIFVLSTLWLSQGFALPTKFVIAGSATQTAGATNNLTITATDSLGVTLTTYSGSKTLTFSGASSSLDPVQAPTVTDKNGTPQAFGTSTVITFTAGVATGVPMILYRAESASIAATDGTLLTPAPLAVTVSFASLAKFSLAPTSPQTNGVAFTGTNTLTARDAYGNTVISFNAGSDNVTLSTSLAGTISGLGSGLNNVLNQAGNFSNGVADLTFLGMKYTGTSGTGTFNATSASGKVVSSPPSITVNPGAAIHFSITGTPTQIAGASQALTITALDASGNTATAYVGTKTLTFAGANSSTNPITPPTINDNGGIAVSFGSTTSIDFSSGVASVTANRNGVMTLYKAEGALITATQGSINTPTPFTVLVSAADVGKMVLQMTSGQTSGIAFTGTNTITAQDNYGNVVTNFTAVADNVVVVANSPLNGTITGLGVGLTPPNVLDQAGDFVTGVANVTGKLKYTGIAGTGTITATTTTTNKTGTSGNILVNGGGATHFVISGSPSQTAGTPQNLTILAKDPSENTDATYTGDKSLTFSGAGSSTDPVITPKIVDKSGSDVSFGTATTITFTNGVASVASGKNGAMKLYKAENASITATEGSLNTPTPLPVTVGNASFMKIAMVLTSPQTNGVAFAGTNTVAAQDSFGNPVVSFDAGSDNATINTSLTGAISGLGSGNNNVLNRTSDFTSGLANIAGKIKYTGATGVGTFSVSSQSGKTDATPPTVTINPGGATRLVITGTATQVAGTTQNLTITARDNNGNVSTTYTGSKTLTFSGANSSTNPVTAPKVTDATGADKLFGTATTITFTSGVATVGGGSNGVMTLYKTETATISVTDGTIGSSGADRLTVNVTPGSLSKFVFDIQTPQSNGTALTGVDTLAAQDAYGNLVTTFDAASDKVTITANSPLSGRVVGLGSGGDSVLNRTSDFSGGIANLSGVMKYFGASGTGTFKAQSFSNKTGSTDPVTVNPGAVRRFLIAGSGTQTAGTIQPLTITAKDTTGNTVTAYTGDQSLTFTGANPSSNPPLAARVFDKTGSFKSFGSAATITFTNGVATASATANGAIQLFKAETAAIVATQGSVTTQTPLQVVVSNATLGQFSLSFASPQINGTAFTGLNTIAAQDSFGNTVATFDASANNVTLVSNTPLVGTVTGLGSLNNGVLNRVTDFTAGIADVTGKLVYTGSAGTGTFTATSASGRTGNSGNIVINNPTPTLTSINPSVISRSQTLDVGLRGSNFITNVTQPSFGDSITVLSVLVNRSDSLTARIVLAPGTALGPRNVSVTNVGAPTATLTDGLTVNNVPSLTSIEPNNGLAGLSYTLTFTGTNFYDGISSVGQVGPPGVTVNTWQVNSLTKMTVSVTVSSGASTGPRQLFVYNSGPSTYGGQSGFQSFSVGDNPVPTLTNVQPDSAYRLQRVTLVFTGSNFFTGITDVKMGDGIRVDSVIVDSSTQLRATVTVMDTAATGTRPVYVQNKTPGGGASGTKPFKINNPLPTLTGVSPANANRQQTLGVVFVGTNFIQGVSTVNFGPGITRVRPDSVNSPIQLTASVRIDSNAATGPRSVSITNAGPGGGTSSNQTFTINNPHPTITSLSDTTKIVNSPQFTLVVNGTNFVGESKVFLNGIAKTTTPVSSTRLNATIPASDLDTAVVFLVAVANPAPGGDTSNVVTFTVKNPVPSLVSASPDSAARLQSINVQLTGSNFVRGFSTVQLSGDISVDSTTVTDTAHMMVKITIPATSQIGDHMIIVTNPPPGGGTSASITFKVTNNPAPTILTLSPATGNRLQKLDVSIVGTNFINGVTTVGFGTGITTDSVIVANPTHLTAKITITPAAATGLRSVTVTNAPPGGGSATMANAFQVNNPSPALISVSPTNGDQLQTLDLTFRGRNFIDGVTYVYMGTGISVNGYSEFSDTSFKASITITNFAVIGPRNVQVTNPQPGGGTDQLVNGFVVGNNPKPTLTGINPTSGHRLDSMNVQFRGTNFISGATTVDMGTGIDIVGINVDSSSQLTASIFIRPTAPTGLRNVYVINSPPGGGKDSIVNGFNVTNPSPTLATVTPSTVHRMQRVDLVLRGTKFINGVTFVNPMSGITVVSTSADSSTRMAVTVTVDTFAVTGARSISVTNPTPGGGTSGTISLTVDNPTPTLTDVQPASGSRLQTLNITITGTNFIRGISHIAFTPPNDIAVNSMQVDSSNQITANISIGVGAATGPRSLTVVNDSPGGGSSAAKTFTVAVNIPDVPVPTYPPDNAANIPTTVSLSWSTSTNASAYHVQLATTVGFGTTLVNDTNVTATSRQVGPLNNNILYFWRVRARNSAGTYSNWSSIRRFTTKPAYPDTMPIVNTWVFPPRNPGESVVADYKIIGLPGNSNAPVASFIPGAAGTDWQMYWDNGTPTVPGCYVKYDQTSSRFTFTTGAAFWLIMRSSWTVNTTINTAALNDSGKVGIPLHAGWNLITNPFGSAVFWYQVQAANGGFIQALNQYNSGWATSSTFAPYAGYIFSNETNLDTLWIPYSIVTFLGKSEPPSISDGWRVSIDLQSGQYIDRVTSFGVSATAKEGLDRFDNRRPRGMVEIPTVSFHRPEWDQKYSDFATDIRPEFQDVSTWDFEVTSKARKPIQLTFNGIGTVPPQFQVYLIDESRSRYVDLRANPVYEFTPAMDISKMRAVVGTPDAVKQQLSSVLPTEFALGNNFPNPFNPTTTIPVSIPRLADVALKVYATTGEEVRTIYAGDLAPGRYWFTWDGRNDRGNSVATGVYFVRLTTLAGPTFTGKMLLMK